MPGRIVHLQGTSRGAGNIRVSMGDVSTVNGWGVRGLYLRFAATFTSICTVSLIKSNHEGSIYNIVMDATQIATAAGVLQRLVYNPVLPTHYRGKDACIITIDGASAANEFNYEVVLQED